MRLPTGWLPSRKTVVPDMLAAVPNAISSVPDGMASGVLAGVGPAAGLYASVAGPLVGGATSSTTMMIVATTGPASLTTASVLGSLPADDRIGAMTLLSLLAGAFMMLAGLLRLARYTRFVSHSVMIGFLTGIAVNIVLSQLGDLSGADPEGSLNLTKAAWLVVHPGSIDPTTLVIGLVTIALLVVLDKTSVGALGSVIALVLPSAAVQLLGLDSVAQVRDGGDVPAGFPLPSLPDFGAFSFDLLAGAAAIAVIALVQGVGVAEAAPNPDGSPSSLNRDFLAQGYSNVAAGFVQAQPIGASVGQTALNVAAGARTRWAAIFSGLWMLLILLGLSTLIGYVATPTLAALLIVAGVGAIRISHVRTVLRTGAVSQVGMISTFVATLLLPVPVAVAVGVAISLLMQLNREALDLKIVRVTTHDGRWRESAPPKQIGPREIVVLDVYGSLLYAGSRTLQSRLPAVTTAHRSAVVIRLRGRTQLGATFFLVADQYAMALRETGSRLYLSGVDPALREQHRRNRGPEDRGLIEVFPATELVGESTDAATDAARAWVTGGEPG